MSMTHMTREQVKEHERIICKRAIALFRCAPESRSGDADGMSVDIMTAADGLRGHALATLDALDAALERERVLLAERDGVDEDKVQRFVAVYQSDGVKPEWAASAMVPSLQQGVEKYRKRYNGYRAMLAAAERLAAARTPVDRECSICGKVAPHRPDEGLCIECADELVRCNERLEAREPARTPEVVGEIGETE
jgi:hypothetical protein